VTRLRITYLAALTSVVAVLISTGDPAFADSVRDAQWHLNYLDVPAAQKISNGGGIVVAVIDTGVDPHRDLRNNLLKGTDVIGAGHGNGQVDTDGHGTEMAGLIAAHGRHAGTGVLGIAPAAEILPVKDADATDNGGTTTVAAGIKWAAQRKAEVINVSAATGPSTQLSEAVKAALAADSIIVAGSGNRPRMLTFGYPAAMPGVLAVGAIDRSGEHADVSMTGSPMQLCAPGVDITSTEPKGKYAKFDGTSPATAIVSGAAALLRAKYPDMSAPEVIHRLTATADDIGKPGRDDECGYGILNIVKALTADVPPLSGSTSASPSAPPTPTTGDERGRAAEPAGRKMSLVLGGVAAAAVILITLLVVRRRKRP
jgi:type VII secretion-associated serine protease mycosin